MTSVPAAAQTINVAVVGPGKIAERFLVPALAKVPGAQLWSVCSRDAGRAEDFARRHGAASPRAAHTDLTALLDDPLLHAVILATPDALHAEEAIACARAGKHILVEKPMCTDAAAGRAMVQAAQVANVRLGIAYHLRWHAGHRALAQRVHAGELGELRHVRVAWTYKADDASNWRASKDLGRWWGLAGVGTHCLDLARWFMTKSCGEVVEVKSLITRAVWKGPNDETALVMLRFASGATAEIVTSVLFDSVTAVEIHGAKASATCEGTLGPHGAGRVRAVGADVPFKPVNPYVGELTDFVAAIREGRATEVDGVEGVRNVEILLEAAPR